MKTSTASSAPPVQGPGRAAVCLLPNTMSSCVEALGMSLPGTASIPALDPRRPVVCRQTGEAVMRLLADGNPPPGYPVARGVRERHCRARRDGRIHQRGCSTSWRSPARQACRSPWPISIESAAGRPTSRTCARAGRYTMADLDRIGGVPVVLRELLDGGYLRGDVLTVTGRTLADNLREARRPGGQDVVRSVRDPISRVAPWRSSAGPRAGRGGDQDRRRPPADVPRTGPGLRTGRRRVRRGGA